MLILTIKKINKFISFLTLKPTQLMVLSFAFVIGIGTFLLMLPIATKTGIRTSVVDALFTATSATCVTGLIVKNTASYFSIFGQLVIVGLIQIGGLGIMTFSMFLVLLIKKKSDIKQQITMKEVVSHDTLANVKNLIFSIIKITFIFEILGAIFLFISWKDKFSNILVTIYHSIFHAVSAFCNAGFSTFTDNLMKFSGNILTNVTICLLIISGGLGFFVIKDLYNNFFDNTKKIKLIKLKVQTKIVVVMSFLLILIGGFVIYIIENNGAFSSFSIKEKILVSLFQSVTTRTAGFNSCDIAMLSSTTLFVMVILMFIGASPGSTGGGIKTTTLFVLWTAIISGIKQKENVEIYKRTIPFEIVQKAMTVFLISLSLVVLFTTMLLYVEKKNLIAILFEVVSAFGTVGLSTGITFELSNISKILLTLLMFIGRLGPLTIAYIFATTKPSKYYYAEEKVMIG